MRRIPTILEQSMHRVLSRPARAASPEEFSRICAAITVASLPAWVAAGVVCRPPVATLHGWPALLGDCVSYFFVTLLAGGVSLALAGMLPAARPRVGLLRVFLHALPGWLFLPAVSLLERINPGWALPVIAAAAAAMAASLRQLAPEPPPAEPQPTGPPLPSLAAPALYERRLATARPLRALIIAFCAWGALAAMAARNQIPAACALGLGAFLLLWYAYADSGLALAPRLQRRWLSGAAVTAWLLCVGLLLPWLLHGGRGLSLAASVATQRAQAAARARSHYTSVILWPPKPRITRLYFPTPQLTAQPAARLAHPIEIPFDGPYWYFEPPDDEPSPTAHIARGLPTERGVNLSSADGGPLRMEAIQHLAQPISLSCCAALDVAIEDAEAERGLTSLGVLLTDNSSAQKPTLLLGFVPTATPGAQPAGPAAPQSEETVHFPIPPSRSLRRFNQITVIVLPTLDRWRGARIAVEGFTLQPK